MKFKRFSNERIGCRRAVPVKEVIFTSTNSTKSPRGAMPSALFHL